MQPTDGVLALRSGVTLQEAYTDPRLDLGTLTPAKLLWLMALDLDANEGQPLTRWHCVTLRLPEAYVKTPLCFWLLPLCLFSAACSARGPDASAPHVAGVPAGRSGYVAGEGGVRLFYRVEGRGADTILVLHGGPGLNLEGLRPDLGPLAHRRALLYFDQRGSGHSDMPDTLRLTAALMVEDVEAVRRAFRVDRLTILGHSWGGSLAVLYAGRYPDRVRRLVLVGPVPPRPHPYFAQYDSGQRARRSSAESARMAELDSIQSVAADPYPVCRETNRIYLRGVAATPEAADRIRGDLCAGTPANLRLSGVLNRLVWASIGDADTYDWRPMAAGIAAPTLVVHGDRDPLPLAGSVEWVEALPNARLVVMPGVGHYPHAEQPQRFFAEVERFLAAEAQ